jgi:aspartokinase/homoserine dehydrogenase 1
MKVLKFGGTSVASPQAINNLTSIVLDHQPPVIVVVSALAGVTDQLINLANLAAAANPAYLTHLDQLASRHRALIIDVVPPHLHTHTAQLIHPLLDELANILRGIFLINDLSPKSYDTILAYGERLSSAILASAIPNAQLFDARKFIKTIPHFNRHIVDFPSSNALIQQTFTSLPPISIVPGFIASDTNDQVTNLGRGGSDYTASILAAALDADSLEIWTDVDGFMTADPKVINSAYLIDKLSFTEAMELCNFGAKVLYPPTIYPVYQKNIPIRILNTFNPNSKGTFISHLPSSSDTSTHDKPVIKGISSINDTCLVTVQGLGMVGVIGVNYRIFKSLSDNGISVFMVSQASSENNTSFAVCNADAHLAVDVLNHEFANERARGEINDTSVETDLATVAIVGENMKRTPGIAGKLFGTLGRAGISVIACAQGASETNISFVIKLKFLRKALNSIHDSFFLSGYNVLNLFIAGIGTVGGSLINQIRIQQPTLLTQCGLKINVIGIANASKMLLRRDGIDLDNFTLDLQQHGLPNTPDALAQSILDLDIFNSVFVDCTASPDIASLYHTLLSNNVSVVAANKNAAASPFPNYRLLKDTARKRDVKFLFETNVGAGLPIINTMNALINSGDRILKLQAVLSGTLNFIFNTLNESTPFSHAIRLAREAGYAEPDPRIDLSGTDVLRKLVILAREAGYPVEQADVSLDPIIPPHCFLGSLDDFWRHVATLDHDFEQRRLRLASLNKRLRFVATMDNGNCSLALQEVDARHPFFELEGSNNIIMISTERYNEYPMVIKGYGAGADVTAAGVFADIISIANIR